MAISYSIAKHAAGFPAKCLASEGGAHILNIKVTTAAGIDNGTWIGKGAYQGIDQYLEAAPTSVAGTVLGKSRNGNWYVEIESAVNAFFVYNVPINAEEWTNEWKKEGNFFNAKGDIVKAYEVKPYDVVEISELGFTVAPAAGDTVALSGNKLVPSHA